MIIILSAIRSSLGHQKNLLQLRGHDFSAVGSMAEQFDMLFLDKELTLLLFWAVIAPAAGIGYLIWLKYPKLRMFAMLAFAVGLVQFSAQVPGLISFFSQFGIVLRI
ncbi:MAG: hypothetical protein ABH863_00120 [Candidatus Micrarchaeota archaeon]